MEIAIMDRLKSQARNLQTLSDELRVQMALGKAEAKDVIEAERKTLSQYISKQKKEISKIEDSTNENRKEFLTSVETLESALSSEIPSTVKKYDKYKNEILNKIYKLEEEIKENYPDVSASTQESLNLFKNKMDAYRVNLALHDKDNPEKVEKIRNDFTTKLGEIREVLSNRENAQSKLDNFVEDISESFTYLKRAIANLSH